MLSEEADKRDEDKILRYFCALSLAEGETIRRVIHMRHPVLNDCAVALRSLEGGIIDQSSHFWKESEGKQVALSIEALKFINCEMYYKDNELEILEEALAGAPLEMRKQFFEDCLRLRRHERNVWDDTPLAKIFTPQEEWHMIRARAVLQQVTVAIERAIKTRNKPKPWWNPYDLFKEYVIELNYKQTPSFCQIKIWFFLLYT